MAMSDRPRAAPALRKRRRSRITLRAIRRRIGSWGRTVRALFKALRSLPTAAQIFVSLAALLVAASGANWAYHTLRKPTEVFFPLADTLDKQPFETWKEYGPLFREHATDVITADLLAALAQVESAGNPVARTYWRWRMSWNPFEVYRPASSAVGMFQITDATFREGVRYCIHDHRVVQDGRWHDMHSCWFNSLYSRVVPSHAIQLTSALLDRRVASALGPQRIGRVTLRQKQNLAAVIHLCGATVGRAYVTRGFQLTHHQRCGNHDVRNYLAQVNAMKYQFARLSAAG